MNINKSGIKKKVNTLARIATALPLPTPSDAPLPFKIFRQKINTESQ